MPAGPQITRAAARPACGLLVAVALASVACGGGRGRGSGTTTPTLIAVDPADFLVDITCGAVPGGARRYVATITDLTGNDDADLDAGGPTGQGLVLPSSGPTDCHQQVAFGFVEPGRRYAAEVDIYDRADLTPLGSGSPLMGDADGELATPRWSTRCGFGEDSGDTSEAALSVLFLKVFVKPCEDPVDRGESPTGLGVDLQAALDGAGLSCGTEPGQVDRFEVSLRGSAEPTRELSCGEVAEPWLGLEAGRGYTFDVTASGADPGAPTYQTTCFAVAASGVVLQAGCDPLLEITSDEPDAG